MLLELCPAGFEEEERVGEVLLAAYGDARLEGLLRARFGSVSVAAVEPGWEHAWRSFHRPVVVGPLWVGPPWERPEPGSIALVVDPGQAFGTGAHATTRLCLELLAFEPPSVVIDLGCGSGVLAIAAALLVHDVVLALDHDEAAVEATRGNARANGVRFPVECGDALTAALPRADLALANLELGLVERLGQRALPPRLIASGFLAQDSPHLPGWQRIERRELDGWAAELLATDAR